MLKPNIVANRPIRACNPGSLDWHPEFHSWAEDLADPPHDTNLNGTPGRVAVFVSPTRGTKRLAVQVGRYLMPVGQGGHGYDTLRKYISNYAPNNDPKAHNDEASYCRALAMRLGLKDSHSIEFVPNQYGVLLPTDVEHPALDAKLNVAEHLVNLVLGIAHQETGHELGDIWDDPHFIEDGISMAKQHLGLA